MDLSIRVIAIMLFCDRSHFASRHPHLSVVQVVKDHFLLRQTLESVCSTEARLWTASLLLSSFSEDIFSEKPNFLLPLLLLPQSPLSLAAAGEVRILRIFQNPSIPFLKIVSIRQKTLLNGWSKFSLTTLSNKLIFYIDSLCLMPPFARRYSRKGSTDAYCQLTRP